MEDWSTRIPPSLLAQIIALKDLLVLEGSVQLHHGENRRLKYRLRYRSNPTDGRRVHRSLELGPDYVAYAVQDLLREWRKENRPLSQPVIAEVPSEERQDKIIKQCMRDQAKAAGAGRPFQAKVGKMYDAAMNGSNRDAFKFMFTEQYLKPPKRGRPRKSRLW